MKHIVMKKTGQEVPAVVVGCMRQAGFTDKPFRPQDMNRFIHIAVENGANFFDHADIYGLGYLDVLLLHRPDALIEPEEAAHSRESCNIQD